MNFKFVYKICSKFEWQEVKTKGQLTGSKKDLADGYIHFSGDDQIVGTLKKFWKDHTLAIKKFHRYPHRNMVLGRKSSPEEIEFLNQPNSSW